LLAKAS